ncbi:hypothetical protein [Sphingomonas sp.]|jgi:hypothetical protein|uniref:hypothetical protein n=1 Tax=Sphingomonas sp. TaxID=28214 RepID=UPI00356AE152
MIYRPKHFKLTELVDPDIYAARGDRAWELLQPAILVALDDLRAAFGPVVVNNWADGGPYKESGLRTFTTKTGAPYSMHRFGGAMDCKIGIPSAEAVDYIVKHRLRFPTITTMERPEATPTWLHIDCRNHGRDDIWIVNP